MSSDKAFSPSVFEEFFQASIDMLCIASTDGYFKLVNPAFERMLGWTEDELLSRPYIDFVHPDDVERTQNEVESLSAGVPTISFENRYRTSDGSYKNLHWTAFPQEETELLFGIARDNTEMMEASRRFRVVLEASPVSTLLVDQEGIIRLINTEAERIFGYDRDDLLGCSIDKLIPSRHISNHRRSVTHFFEHSETRPMGRGRHLIAVRENGYEFPVEIGLKPIELDNGIHVIASIVDLTLQRDLENKLIEAAEELRQTNERLSRLATTDELTGLMNRRAFDEELMAHIRLMQRLVSPLSLLIIDLDQFKELNDQFGHAAGDNALQETANILKQTSRGSDIAARQGGDEFAVILPNTDVDGALMLAEKIRAAVQDHIWHERDLTISVGASTTLLPGGKSPNFVEYHTQIVSAADRALYESKDRGGNQVTHASMSLVVEATSEDSA